MPTKTASATQSAIRAISAGAVSALLTPAGFKRRSPHFWRLSSDLYHCVNFQASQWGTHEEGSFTINLALTSPTLYFAFTGNPFPKNPASALWPVNLRIGRLMADPRDHWWPVSPSSDLGDLSDSVVSVLRDYALPYFDRFASQRSLMHAVLDGDRVPGILDSQRQLLGAMLAASSGDSSQARTLLAAARTRHQGKPFESTVTSAALRLGVDIDGA